MLDQLKQYQDQLTEQLRKSLNEENNELLEQIFSIVGDRKNLISSKNHLEIECNKQRQLYDDYENLKTAKQKNLHITLRLLETKRSTLN